VPSQAEGNHPVVGFDWHDAAKYCNWLSKRDGILKSEWCYVAPDSPLKADENPNDVLGQLVEAPDFRNRRGYRLPTTAEWELACRSGTITSRYYGATEELLEKYEWYEKNSGMQLKPAGLLKPNGLGLFDMLGNVSEWCHDGLRHNSLRACRGGCHSFPASGLALFGGRSAFSADTSNHLIGFRVAMTLD
jgi:formylglycine-generating enzyme required for sulfatase activity